MKTKSIKAICFDLDGVYFPSSGKKAFKKALVELAGNEPAVIDFLYKSEAMKQFVLGQTREDHLWDYARESLGLSLTNREFVDLWIKEYTIDPEVAQLVNAVKVAGYITCICSNNNPARVAALHKKFGFLDIFDVKVFSYEVGAFKPSSLIFEALVKECSCDPSEILYSDDNPERIQGAIDLGIDAFIYQDFNQFCEVLTSRGVNY